MPIINKKREHLGLEIECLVLKSTKQGKSDDEGKDSEHYCYICVKRHDADRLSADNWQDVVDRILKEESEENCGEEEEGFDPE